MLPLVNFFSKILLFIEEVVSKTNKTSFKLQFNKEKPLRGKKITKHMLKLWKRANKKCVWNFSFLVFFLSKKKKLFSVIEIDLIRNMLLAQLMLNKTKCSTTNNWNCFICQASFQSVKQFLDS